MLQVIQKMLDMCNIEIDYSREDAAGYVQPIFMFFDLLRIAEKELGISLNAEATIAALLPDLASYNETFGMMTEIVDHAFGLLDNVKEREIKKQGEVCVSLLTSGLKIDDLHTGEEVSDEDTVTKKLNIIFINLLLRGLDRERIKKCACCGNYLYQDNRVSRKYCTISCSNKARNLAQNQKD